MKKSGIFVAVLLLCTVSSELHAQQTITTAVPFLLISPTSRASGMGEAGTGIADDASAIYWNPAGLAFLKGSEVTVTHANWLPQFHLSDLFYDYLNYRQDVPEWGGSIAASITYLNLGEFIQTGEEGPQEIGRFKAFEYAATVGYGTVVAENFGLGMNLRFINDRLSPVGAAEEKGNGIAYDVSFDLAFLYKPKTFIIPFTGLDLGNAFSVGMDLSNMGPKVTYIDAAQADPLPTNLRLGFGYVPYQDEYNSLKFALDFSKLMVRRGVDASGNTFSDPFYKALFTTWTDGPPSKVLRTVVTSGGLEYWYGSPKLIAFRMGYFYEDPAFGDRKFMTFGAGIRYDIYGFDFSYIYTASDQNSPLSDTLRFTLLILWGGIN
ncbi:MAG: type IX secretion system outer membrane channel protein PorV [Bacteroidota bacterium]|nr:type IX secretion system outer membrane channel protein PorV [Bacteroidota bacterium]